MAKRGKTILWAAALLCVLALGWLGACAFLLPDTVCVYSGGSWSYGRGLLTVRGRGEQVAAASAGGSATAGTMYFLGSIPLKQVSIRTVAEKWVVPGGVPFGVKMFTAGVVIASTARVRTSRGAVCPAEEAGLRAGDILLRVDGAAVSGNQDLQAIVSSSEGRALTVEYTRDGQTHTARLTPANAANGSGFKAGMWVKDSSAGIGTLTYIDAEAGVAAGLGHGITDPDSGVLLPVLSGEMVQVLITGVDRGASGAPGELQGVFEAAAPFAELRKNTACGIFGALAQDISTAAAVPVALRQEVHTGAARILCTVDGGGPRYYDVTIESVNLSDANPTKNLILRVTDRALIERTGGIVQGMSGSPILQDGRLVGAVTHVFVNEPTKGYGIFAENMLQSEQIASNPEEYSGAA